MQNSEGSYLILRKKQYLDEERPVHHIGPTNPNRSLIQPNSHVLIEKELDSKIKFVGHAIVNYVEPSTPEFRNGQTQVGFKTAYLKEFVNCETSTV